MRKLTKPAAFLLIWFLLALACNFPGFRIGPMSEPAIDLRETLQAPLPSGLADPTGQQVAPTGVVASPNPGTVSPPPTLQVPVSTAPEGYLSYTTQPGETLHSIALRFDVEVGDILASNPLPEQGYLNSGQVLVIPWSSQEALPSELILPDPEVVYSPATLDFDLNAYVNQVGGYLSTYTEMVDDEAISGVEIIRLVSVQSSINPRLLLAFLEFRSGWVLGQPVSSERMIYPLGFVVPGKRGLYEELRMAATQLNLGYYGWRQGSRVALKFLDGQTIRLHPTVNAGSAAVGNLFSKFYRFPDWQQAVYEPGEFLALYLQMFGDPWQRASRVGQLIPDGLEQPTLELPFLPGERWSLTAGPHYAWDSGTPRAALDFSPVTNEAVCAVSRLWATAAASGVVARAERNSVALDLDGDGSEHTGWVLVYYHLAADGLVLPGNHVGVDDPLGHPSCEGGKATGKHLHIARKYNGEWLDADGPLPLVMSGWQAVAHSRNYQGSLVKGDRVVTSNPGGSRTSVLER